MPAYKDVKTNTWYSSFYFEDWKGARKKKMKRGFDTKKSCAGMGKAVLASESCRCGHEL